jgi:hypothetical protein
MSVNTVECRHCGTKTTADLLESHIAERCPRHRPTRTRNDVAALRNSGAHRQRSGEPPTPYTNALEMRGACAAVPKVLRDADGVPLPWTSNLAARRAAEGL